MLPRCCIHRSSTHQHCRVASMVEELWSHNCPSAYNLRTSTKLTRMPSLLQNPNGLAWLYNSLWFWVLRTSTSTTKAQTSHNNHYKWKIRSSCESSNTFCVVELTSTGDLSKFAFIDDKAKWSHSSHSHLAIFPFQILIDKSKLKW
jgi:hypothetical protein